MHVAMQTLAGQSALLVVIVVVTLVVVFVCFCGFWRYWCSQTILNCRVQTVIHLVVVVAAPSIGLCEASGAYPPLKRRTAYVGRMLVALLFLLLCIALFL